MQPSKKEERKEVTCDFKAILIVLLLLGIFVLGFNFLLCNLREKACIRHIAEAKSSVESKDREMANWQRQVNEASAGEVMQYRGKLAELENYIAQINEEKARFEEQLRQRDHEMHDLDEDLQHAQRNLNNLELLLEEHRNTIDTLQREREEAIAREQACTGKMAEEVARAVEEAKATMEQKVVVVEVEREVVQQVVETPENVQVEEQNTAAALEQDEKKEEEEQVQQAPVIEQERVVEVTSAGVEVPLPKQGEEPAVAAGCHIGEELLAELATEQQLKQEEQQQEVVAPQREEETNKEEMIVAFYPDYREKKGIVPYRGGNPYQELLYSEFASHGVAVKAGDHLLEIINTTEREAHEKKDVRVKKIFHLHWLNLFVCKRTPENARDRVATLLHVVDLIKARGWKLVWTIHNILSHSAGCTNQDIERELAQAIVNKADLIHVLCSETPAMVEPYYVLPPEKVITIPHSSFLTAYPDIVEQQQARKALPGLSALGDKTLILMLGSLRPYKGLLELIDTFERLVPREMAEESNLALFLVGALAGWDNKSDTDRVIEFASNHPAVKHRLSAVVPDQLQFYFKAADVVVLPYPASSTSSLLNSGSLFSAFTFGRPVIAPRLGCMSNYLTDDVSISYDPNDPNGLFNALREAPKLRSDSYRKAALRKAREWKPSDMSKAMLRALLRL